MKVVVQRVLNSSVVIDDKYEEKINKGLIILLGMTYNDGIEDVDYLVNKNDKCYYSARDILPNVQSNSYKTVNFTFGGWIAT